MHKAVDVAIVMLKRAAGKGIELSNLQLQKLVYIAHGFCLALKNSPLINDEVNAWKYGPVINDIYHQFKGYGANKIPTKQLDFIEVENFEGFELDIIDGVLDLFGDMSGSDLIEITHQSDTPWDQVWNKKYGRHKLFAVIPNELIREHYCNVVLHSEEIDRL